MHLTRQEPKNYKTHISIIDNVYLYATLLILRDGKTFALCDLVGIFNVLHRNSDSLEACFKSRAYTQVEHEFA